MSEMKYILAFDQGTTSSRTIVFDRESKIVSMAQREFRQIFPKSGWVEHDPFEIWESQIKTAVDALGNKGIDAKDVAGIGITNQRETTLVWDRETGEPVYNAIVWQDRRTSKFCDQIREEYGELIRVKTGLETDAYFSASKINWILDNIEGVRERAERGELCFGTVDTWLVWKLTAGACHKTDVSNASRTMLFNIHDLRWDDQLLDIFDVPVEILPSVKSSSEVYGVADSPSQLSGVKIAGIAGDQQAALFGQMCFEDGATKNTYGTGCFMLQNTGAKAIVSDHRLLTTVAWQIDGHTEYALEGSVFIGGAVVQWLRDSLGVIKNADEIEALSNSIDDNGGVFFVPAFAGLGTPHWDQDARGMIIGLTRGTGKAHIARAALESIAFQTADLLDAIRKDSGIELSELRVDGGATENTTLLQFQADILGIPVVCPKVSETTALGAAYLAGLAVGFWESKGDLSKHWKQDKRFGPKMSGEAADGLRTRWDQAVKRSLSWENSND